MHTKVAIAIRPTVGPELIAAATRAAFDHTDAVSSVPPARHLLRARDLADRRYADAITVADMARAAHLSPAHFSREFRRAFGESPHQYLLTRRLERAATLLRTTDWAVARICLAVGIQSQATF